MRWGFTAAYGSMTGFSMPSTARAPRGRAASRAASCLHAMGGWWRAISRQDSSGRHMSKASIILVHAVGGILGGLLTLRGSGRAGMPDKDVLERAAKRSREQAAAEKDKKGAPSRRTDGAHRRRAPTARPSGCVVDPRCFPHLARQGEQVAVPPAILGAAVFAVHRFPAHADFFQHPDRGAVVHVHRRDDALGAQIVECRVDEGERNLRRVSLAPMLDAEHVSQVDDAAFDEG